MNHKPTPVTELPPDHPVRQWYERVENVLGIDSDQAAQEAKSNLGSAITPYLLEWLWHPNSLLKTAARKTFALFDFQADQGALIELLKKKATEVNPDQRAIDDALFMSIEALKHHPTPEARQMLIELLHHPNDQISAKAVQTLAQSNAPEALEPLLLAMNEKGKLEKRNQKRNLILNAVGVISFFLALWVFLDFDRNTLTWILISIAFVLNLIREMLVKQKTILKSILSVMVTFMWIIPGALLMTYFSEDKNFMFYLILSMGINLIATFTSQFNQFRQSSVEALKEVKDIRALGPLAVAAQNYKVKTQAIPIIENLLEQVTEDASFCFPPEQMRALLELLDGRSNKFTLKLVHALQFLGDETALEKLKALEQARKTPETIVQKIREALPVLETRIDRLKETRVLLRPAEDHASEELLRAPVNQAPDQAQLLRVNPPDQL